MYIRAARNDVSGLFFEVGLFKRYIYMFCCEERLIRMKNYSIYDLKMAADVEKECVSLFNAALNTSDVNLYVRTAERLIKTQADLRDIEENIRFYENEMFENRFVESIRDRDVEAYYNERIDLFRRAYDAVKTKGKDIGLNIADIEEWSWKNDERYAMVYALRAFYVRKSAKNKIVNGNIEVHPELRVINDRSFYLRFWSCMDTICNSVYDFSDVYATALALYLCGMLKAEDTIVNTFKTKPILEIFTYDYLKKYDSNIRPEHWFLNSWTEGDTVKIEHTEGAKVYICTFKLSDVINDIKEVIESRVRHDSAEVVLGLERIMSSIAFTFMTDSIAEIKPRFPPWEIFSEDMSLPDGGIMMSSLRVWYGMYINSVRTHGDSVKYPDTVDLREDGFLMYKGSEKDIDDSLFGDLQSVLEEWMRSDGIGSNIVLTPIPEPDVNGCLVAPPIYAPEEEIWYIDPETGERELVSGGGGITETPVMPELIVTPLPSPDLTLLPPETETVGGSGLVSPGGVGGQLADGIISIPNPETTQGTSSSGNILPTVTVPSITVPSIVAPEVEKPQEEPVPDTPAPEPEPTPEIPAPEEENDLGLTPEEDEYLDKLYDEMMKQEMEELEKEQSGKPSPETPSQDKPSPETPAQDKPSDVPAPENKPAEDKPTPENKPAEDKPTPENKPDEQTPENKPSNEPTPENKPAEQTPSQDKPSQDKPAEDNSQDIPVQDKPAEDKPAEDKPSEDSSQDKPSPDTPPEEPEEGFPVWAIILIIIIILLSSGAAAFIIIKNKKPVQRRNLIKSPTPSVPAQRYM